AQRDSREAREDQQERANNVRLVERRDVTCDLADRVIALVGGLARHWRPLTRPGRTMRTWTPTQKRIRLPLDSCLGMVGCPSALPCRVDFFGALAGCNPLALAFRCIRNAVSTYNETLCLCTRRILVSIMDFD